MKCSLGCPEKFNPAIGIANLRGKPGTSTQGSFAPYFLCAYHYNALVTEDWAAVNLEGWEPFPQEFVPNEEAVSNAMVGTSAT